LAKNSGGSSSGIPPMKKPSASQRAKRAGNKIGQAASDSRVGQPDGCFKDLVKVIVFVAMIGGGLYEGIGWMVHVL
jgi:hypothetical protein